MIGGVEILSCKGSCIWVFDGVVNVEIDGYGWGEIGEWFGCVDVVFGEGGGCGCVWGVIIGCGWERRWECDGD